MSKGLAHPGIAIRVPDHPDALRAVKALQVMHELIPRFTDIVRTSAEDDGLQVVVRPGLDAPCTDGARVMLPAEEAFADVDPHDPCTCDDDAESCIYHVTVGYLLHEAAHIVEGSTIVPDRAWCKELLEAFGRVGEVDGPLLVEVGIQRQSVFTQLERWADEPDQVIPASVLQLVGRFNTHAPGLCNAIEDARINLAMGERRSALPQQMDRVLEQLVLQSIGGGGINGGPLGYQAGVGMLVQLEHGKDLAPMLTSETVKNCLSDPTVQKLLNGVELRSVADSVALSVVICEHLRMKYGLFNDKTPTGTKARSTLKSGKDTDEDGLLKVNQQVREHEEAREDASALIKAARRATDAREKGSKEWLQDHFDRGGPPADDPNPDIEAFREALDAAREAHDSKDASEMMQIRGGSGFFMSSGQGRYGTIVLRPAISVPPLDEHDCVIKILDGFRYPAGFDPMLSAGYETTTSGVVSASQRKLADTLGLNRRSANIPNLDRGRLHGSKLAKVPSGSRRVFRRVEKPAKRSYAVLIGVDMSGSTSGPVSEYLRLLAYGQATLLAKMGIPFCVVGHTGHRYDPWEGDGDEEWGSEEMYEKVSAMHGTERPCLATLQLAKNFAEPWDTTAKVALSSLQTSNANLDGITLRAYINMLLTQRATDRLLLYYTDGAMPAEDNDTQRSILRSECRRAKAMSKLPDRRLHLVGVGVGTDSPKEYGMDTIRVDQNSGDEGIATVVEGLADRIARTVK